MTSAYHLREVRVDFGETTALNIENLAIDEKKITAIVGANGSGKSTFLRVLSLLLAPTSGGLEFQDRAVRYREGMLLPMRRRITLVAQTPILFQRSVRSNIAYALPRHQRTNERIEAALGAVGLDDFGSRRSNELSGGETQAVAIARAIVRERDCLLFDEPTSSIDRQRAPMIEALLFDLCERGKTIVVSTHDLDQAHRLTDTVISLDRGHLGDPRTSDRRE
jgi:ABC-type sugar transport system ATPase subunit